MEEAPLTTPRLFSRLPTYDTGEWRAAIIYAQALVGASEAAGTTDAVLAEFDSFVDDVLGKLPKLDSLLSSRLVAADVKEGMLQRALGKQASQLFLNFLKVLTKHERLDILRLVHLAFHEQYNRVRKRVLVLVSTAEPLEAAAEQRLEEEIRTRLKLQPVLDKEVRPELIGGVVVRIGDRVFDGSIATQLARLREQMLNRSVHEIQSRRDRFSSSSGN